jgi:hypothetical protein
MTSDTNPGTRWRIVRDVAVFQFKCGLEALLDLTLIPTSLAAAGVDLLVGNWRRPRFFHTVLRLASAAKSGSTYGAWRRTTWLRVGRVLMRSCKTSRQ